MVSEVAPEGAEVSHARRTARNPRTARIKTAKGKPMTIATISISIASNSKPVMFSSVLRATSETIACVNETRGQAAPVTSEAGVARLAALVPGATPRSSRRDESRPLAANPRQKVQHELADLISITHVTHGFM